MKINPITNKEYTILELSTIAREYYDDYRSKQIQSGFAMQICTDGENTMFVDCEYNPQTPDEVVFMCDVRQGADARSGYTRGTGVHLFKTYFDNTEDPGERKIDFYRTVPKFHVKNNLVFYKGKVYRPETEEERRIRKYGPGGTRRHRTNGDINY